MNGFIIRAGVEINASQFIPEMGIFFFDCCASRAAILSRQCGLRFILDRRVRLGAGWSS